MLFMTHTHCKDTIPNIRNKYKGISWPQSQFPHSCVYWAIYIFQRSVRLFCCRKICGPILGLYKLLTDTWMWKLRSRTIPFLGLHKWDFRCNALCVTEFWENIHSRDDKLFIIAVQLLVQAGARADLYNDDLGLAPVHVACQQNRLDMLKVRRGHYVF